MSDLIRRDEALKAIVDERTHTILQAWINVKNTVPSVDAIEVVRCKECKCFNHFEDKEHGEWNTCERHMIFMNPDDFCSYGEREGE